MSLVCICTLFLLHRRQSTLQRGLSDTLPVLKRKRWSRKKAYQWMDGWLDGRTTHPSMGNMSAKATRAATATYGYGIGMHERGPEEGHSLLILVTRFACYTLAGCSCWVGG